LTRGVAGAIPIAVMPFSVEGTPPQNVSGIITNDLQNSGRFKVSTSRTGVDDIVQGQVSALGGDRYRINFQLLDAYKKDNIILQKSYTVGGAQLRALSHHISDIVYEQITGVKGIFSTKIVYVLIQRSGSGPTRYILEVADQDGYNPRPLLNSPEPIMSPSWAPSGNQVAYVSFENHQASIYIEDVATGARKLLTQFPGINGAPAWSPDGRRLALVLSKSGSPNIYVMDVYGKGLTQITNDFNINTEPSWSSDGRSLLFTSNRSGGPQIYQVSASGGTATRISYDGDYNARGSFTRDGKSIAMIHRSSGVYNIALLDLETGRLKVLTSTANDSASPSIAPNGSMVLYDTYVRGKNMLGMVSSDGRVQLLLPARTGDAQDPAWSPFLS
jgi:TolB protein